MLEYDIAMIIATWQILELVRIGNGSEFLSIILLVTRQNHAEMLSHFK